MECPRCGDDKIEVMAKAPVDDAWEVYLCETCHYSWRSTEDINVDPVFKLTPEQIPNLQAIPPVPPLDPQ